MVTEREIEIERERDRKRVNKIKRDMKKKNGETKCEAI